MNQKPRAGNQATRSKYRPVLTAAQIVHILALAKLESPLSDLSISVISTLAPFQAKIENSGILPAYTAVPPKPSTLESLGGSMLGRSINGMDASLVLLDEIGLRKTDKSKEEYWARCYAKYCLEPTICSLEEIQAATEHKYLNDLMSPEEVAAFEEPYLNSNSNIDEGE